MPFWRTRKDGNNNNNKCLFDDCNWRFANLELVIKDFQFLQTDWNWTSDFTGNKLNISVINSSGKYTWYLIEEEERSREIFGVTEAMLWYLWSLCVKVENYLTKLLGLGFQYTLSLKKSIFTTKFLYLAKNITPWIIYIYHKKKKKKITPW